MLISRLSWKPSHITTSSMFGNVSPPRCEKNENVEPRNIGRHNMWKPTTRPTRRSYERAGQTVEFYSPLIVRCPDGQKRTAYIRDNIYGEQTYLGEIRIYHMKN